MDGDEHGGHGHGHSHAGGGGCCESTDLETPSVEGVRYSMNEYIDLEHVVVLNEISEGSGKKVFKQWEHRHDKRDYVESDVDEELLFEIPFSGRVKIAGVVLIGDLDASHPAEMRVFKDRPAQFTLTRDAHGVVDYALNAAKFSSISRLCLHFPSNFGAANTRIYYIGLRGEFQHGFARQTVAIATYEARAMPQDHKGEIPSMAVSRNVF